MTGRLRGEWRCEEGSWRLHRVHLVEALNAPYRAQVTLVSSDVSEDPRELRGRACTFTLERDAFVRTISGYVGRVAFTGPDHDAQRTECTVEVVPALALLAQTRDTRIYQQQTVPAIIEEVFGRTLAPYEREARLALDRTYPTREYAVQYEESHLDFLHRLMEEEGIAYTFDQEDAAEVVVLHDRNGAFPALDSSVGASVRFVPREGGVGDEARVYRVEARSELVTTSVVVRDHDWTAPSRPVVHEERHEDERGRDRELYEHELRTTIGDYDEGAGRYGAHDVADQARLRRELQASGADLIAGEGDVAGFSAGRTFTLEEHPGVLDGDYLLRSVEHWLRVDEHGWAGAGDYRNTFEAQPVEVPYRPARRTAHPRVKGPQLATVTGPRGPNTTHTDRHGRIKVQFYWDRLGRSDEHSSCWVRVQQPMAGPGTGHQQIPRVGAEVLVTFVNGDPDRPIVTGALHNGDNAGPFHDPNDPAVAQMRAGFHFLTDGEGAAGYNELSFNNAREEEQIRLHAQNDLDETVRRDHVTRVLRHQSQTVTGNQTETVTGDASLTVEQSRTKTIEHDERIEVHGARSTEVRKNETEQLKANRVLEIDGDETKTVGGARKLTIRGTTTQTHKQTRTVTVEQDESLTVSGQLTTRVDAGPLVLTQGANNQLAMSEGTNIEIRTDGSVVIRVEGSRIEMTGDRIELTATQILMNGQEAIRAGVGECKMELAGGNSVLRAETEARVEAGASFVATTSGATVDGDAIALNGTDIEAVAAQIKLN